MENVSDKRCRENRSTQFVVNDVFFFFFLFFFANPAVYEIMCKNIVEPGRPQITKWRMHIAWWIPRAANPHSGCVIAYLFLVHCNNGCTNVHMLRYTCIASLVNKIQENKISGPKGSNNAALTCRYKKHSLTCKSQWTWILSTLRQPLDLLNKHVRHKMKSYTGGIAGEMEYI